jgi:hypothetical protein
MTTEPADSSCERAPGWRALAGIFCAAVALRWLFYAVVARLTGHDAHSFAELADGHSYLAMARVLAGAPVALNAYDLRVFPGLPMLLAPAVWLPVSPAVLALALNWLATGGVAVLGAVVLRDWRVGVTMAVLPPTFVMESAGVASEPTMLLCGLLSVWCIMRERPVASGVAVGLAMAIRPMALAILAGLLVWLAGRREPRKMSLVLAGVAGALLVVGGWLHLALGDVFASFRTQYHHKDAYAGAPFCLPLQNFIAVTLARGLPPLRLAFLWGHAVAAIGACGLLWREAWAARNAPPGGRPAWFWATWLLLNTGVALCINGFWGVQIFPRLLVPALPAMVYAFRPWLPRGWMAWGAIAAGSFALAVYLFVTNQRLLAAAGG